MNKPSAHPKKLEPRGAWVAHWLKLLTLDFGSRSQGREIEPGWDSLSLCPPPLPYALSLKYIESLKKKVGNKVNYSRIKQRKKKGNKKWMPGPPHSDSGEAHRHPPWGASIPGSGSQGHACTGLGMKQVLTERTGPRSRSHTNRGQDTRVLFPALLLPSPTLLTPPPPHRIGSTV